MEYKQACQIVDKKMHEKMSSAGLPDNTILGIINGKAGKDILQGFSGQWNPANVISEIRAELEIEYETLPGSLELKISRIEDQLAQK